MTKSYGGIAVRKYVVPQTTTLTYLIGDQLGSTSVAVDSVTGEAIETLYKPWGEVRWTTENRTLPTRYTFTGQYSYMADDATDIGSAGFGLMFYNERWYDPQLGRFAQADTIVPGGPQGMDRYAYVNNNPVNYTDPSGHATANQCARGQARGYACQIVDKQAFWNGYSQVPGCTLDKNDQKYCKLPNGAIIDLSHLNLNGAQELWQDLQRLYDHYLHGGPVAALITTSSQTMQGDHSFSARYTVSVKYPISIPKISRQTQGC